MAEHDDLIACFNNVPALLLGNTDNFIQNAKAIDIAYVPTDDSPIS
ncbi:hypothetical protein [Frondihabitans sp. VKM Ac-2883]|nr:hypothetical protein [Frondihabitans sp. VKM Ac-2883]MBF4575194.1 hypothetical protein [Frondihabitans sp. VKM Ac-2883]